MNKWNLNTLQADWAPTIGASELGYTLKRYLSACLQTKIKDEGEAEASTK